MNNVIVYNSCLSLLKVSSVVKLTVLMSESQKNYFKAPKKSEIVIFPGRILLCKQNRSAIYSILHHIFPRLGQQIKAIAANWCPLVRTWGDTPATLIVSPTLGRRHHHVAQCCRNIQPSFNKCLGIHKVCLGFNRIHRNVDKKYFNKSGGYTTLLQN